ncbi:accessory gene regulator B family protein [Paenibacillus piri]|uniref:accessory gene regulator B family protein n=1 Tax=Paenibacillus piri TaxID=2547395 RepID=UPI003CCC6E65
MAILVYNERNDYLTLPKVKFAIHFFLNLFFVFATVVLFSILFNNTAESLYCFFAFIFLRFISGGSWHFKNDLICYLFSSLILVLIPFISIKIELEDPLNWTLNVVSLIVIAFFSPASKRNIGNKRKWGFKIASTLIVLIHFAFINSAVLTLAFFVQAVSIIPIKFKRNDSLNV